jgi:hypothetical protein
LHVGAPLRDTEAQLLGHRDAADEDVDRGEVTAEVTTEER